MVNSRWYTSGINRTKTEMSMSAEVRQRLLSIIEARKELGGIGHTTIYDLIKRREVVKVSIGRRSFTAESLAAYIDRITAAASAGVA
jgi:predicted DNA-binding transcriptional regulator AlpA